MHRKLLLWALCFVAWASLHARTKSGGLPFLIQSKQVEPAPKPSGLGRPANAEELRQRDITTLPSGVGLPDGKGTAAQGEAVYRDKCDSCHGPNGRGNGPFPRLAGQLFDYTSSKLTNWDKERGQDPKNPDNSAIMEPIAHGLNEAQIKAVAAYVSYLE